MSHFWDEISRGKTHRWAKRLSQWSLERCVPKLQVSSCWGTTLNKLFNPSLWYQTGWAQSFSLITAISHNMTLYLTNVVLFLTFQHYISKLELLLIPSGAICLSHLDFTFPKCEFVSHNLNYISRVHMPCHIMVNELGLLSADEGRNPRLGLSSE